MLVLDGVQQLPPAPEGGGIFKVACPVFRQVLRSPEGVALPLVVDVAADGDFHMLREGEVEIHLVTLPDGTVTVAGVIDGEVEKDGVLFVVNGHN